MNTRKLALVAGGARMGSVVAKALAERGFDILLTYRSSKSSAEAVVSDLHAQGFHASALPCDLSREASIQRLVNSIRRRWGRLDVIVNLASIYEKTLLRSLHPVKEWDASLAANARGGYLLSVLAAPLMRKSGGGHIVHIADWTSASGRPRYRDYAPYYVSKVAVKGMVEALALELSPKILVNAIAPGPILPPPGMSTREKQAVEKATPLGRWGGPSEIAKAVLFLVETDFVTGETIRVDGGRHLY
jgi:NAD(P)-dependent dehydrogenase (short-subunit alcohol dehydrogenase family)